MKKILLALSAVWMVALSSPSPAPIIIVDKEPWVRLPIPQAPPPPPPTKKI